MNPGNRKSSYGFDATKSIASAVPIISRTASKSHDTIYSTKIKFAVPLHGLNHKIQVQP
jgi:hypothetical protein